MAPSQLKKLMQHSTPMFRDYLTAVQILIPMEISPETELVQRSP